MIDLLRDPVWQFIGAILGILAIIVSIIIFLIQRKNKIFSYEINSATAVLSGTEEISGQLKILYKGKVVKNVSLLVIKLMNTGNVPIISSDYERNVELVFNNCDKILSAEISESTPSNLSGEIYLSEKSVGLKPLLLNPNDSITLKILLSGSLDFFINGRIVGINKIGKKAYEIKWLSVIMFLGLGLFMAGLLLQPRNAATTIYLIPTHIREITFPSLFIQFGFYIMVITMTIYIVRYFFKFFIQSAPRGN